MMPVTFTSPFVLKMSLITCVLSDTDILSYSLYIDDAKNGYLFPCCARLLSTLDQEMEEVPET